MKFPKQLTGIFFFFIFAQNLLAGTFFQELTTKNSKVQRKWSNPRITWRFNSTGAPAGAQSIIQQAFQTWEQQTSAQISDSYAGTITSTKVALDGYSDFFFNISLTALGAPSNIIALTLINSTISDTLTDAQDAIITEADILINPDLVSQLVTTIPTAASDLDLNEILTHEIGHVFGIGHSFLIDSMMYPAKPPTSASTALKDLYRVPKRTLAQDDIAWMNSLYPPSNFEEATAQVQGQVVFNGSGYIGAHIVLFKTDDPDGSIEYYSPQSSLIAKGMQNVSAFSEEDGKFTIKGLKAGIYKIFTQNSNSFMSFSLANVNSYLNSYGSTNTFPLQFWKNPDCASGDVVSASNLTSVVNASASFTIAANQAYCGIQIEAHNGGSTCGSTPNLTDRCSSDDGCNLNPNSQASSTPWILLTIGFILIVGIFRKQSSGLSPWDR